MFLFVTVLIFLAFIVGLDAQYVISALQFQPGTSQLPGNRDGILIATLNDGRQTTICNYHFTQIDANVACQSLGYPATGYSLIYGTNTNPPSAPVLLGDFQCVGTETNLQQCPHTFKPFTNACASHGMDVYIYCLQPQVTTTTTGNVFCGLNSLAILSNNGNYKNTGFLQVLYNSAYYYVCNNDYLLTQSAAIYYCNIMCNGTNNPQLIMPFQGNISITPNFVKLACTSTSCSVSNIYSGSCSSYAIGLKCGNEPANPETAPTVICTNITMNIYWPTNTTPTISTNLVSVATACSTNSNIQSNTTYSVIITIDLRSSYPIVQTYPTFISYSCFLSRSYLSVGGTTPPTKQMQVSCQTPLPSNPSGNVIFSNSGSLISNAIPTNLVMTFYKDNSFTTPMTQTYSINADQLMYVAVQWTQPTPNTILILKTCNVSYNYTSSNSVTIINNGCPDSTYSALIYTLGMTTIGFQFSPFNLYQTTGSQVYIYCTVTKCATTESCSLCPASYRKKRSAEGDNAEEMTMNGPISISVK